MADFLPALAYTLGDEGGYANNPHDRGGETFCGISRKNWPTWGGWLLIDAMKPNKPQMHDEKLAPMVAGFYRANFWKFGDIEDQALANKLMDTAVLMGVVRCVKFLQGAVVACEKVIPIDGVLGPMTVAAANGIEPPYLLSAFKQEMVEQIRHIVERDPSQAVFVQGWMARAEKA